MGIPTIERLQLIRRGNGIPRLVSFRSDIYYEVHFLHLLSIQQHYEENFELSHDFLQLDYKNVEDIQCVQARCILSCKQLHLVDNLVAVFSEY